MENIKIYDNGKEILHEDVLKMALDRAYFTLQKYRTLLGHKGLCELFKDEIAQSDEKYIAACQNSRPGEYKYSTLEFHVKDCSAAAFMQSFINYVATKGRESHPEHFAAELVAGGDGPADIVETVGDDSTIARFKIVPATDPDAFPFQPDPDCTFCMRSSLTSVDGQPYGIYIFHQFKNVGDDLIAKLCIVFPEGTDDAIVEGHKRHIAVEYLNWFTFASEFKKATQG